LWGGDPLQEKVKAFVLKDGSVISDQLLRRFSLKESKQIKGGDEFTSFYQQNQIVQPKYRPKLLADLMERNTYHYRAVKTKAKDTVGLGWHLIPLVETPNEQQKLNIEQLLYFPHPDQTLEEIFTQWMEDYEATGNGYVEVIRDRGLVVGFEHIPAHTMRRHRDEVRYVQVRGNKRRWFKKIGTKEQIDTMTGEISEGLNEEQQANEVIHIMNYTSSSDYYGLPDILPVLGALLGDEQREAYNIDFFENYAIPSYAVTVAGAELDDETMNQIRQYFQKDLKENRHSTLVLSAPNPLGDGPAVEFQFEKLAVDVGEASFRLYRLDNRDEVLAAHGVPPYRMGIAETGSLGGSTAVESTESIKRVLSSHVSK
jgi:PBSX family phage portal protein